MPLHPQKNRNKQLDNIKNAAKNFDYTTIVDRLRTVSWSNISHPIGVVKPVYEHSTLPLAGKVVQSIVLDTVEISCKIQTYFHRDTCLKIIKN